MIPDTDEITEKNRHLVRKIYDGALNPSDFNEVFQAWDDYFLALGAADSRKQSEDFTWMDEIVSHFETAGAVVDKLYRERELPLEQRIRALPYAALVCDLDGTILAGNDRAAEEFGPGPLSPEGGPVRAQAFMFDPAAEAALTAFAQAVIAPADTGPDGTAARTTRRMIVRLFPPQSEEVQVFLADRAETTGSGSDQKLPRLLLRSLTASWSAVVVDALQTAYGLTAAELTLVENLYKGLSIREIADKTSRSQGTLRTQLHSVLTKTGTRGQADLLRIVAGLVQVLQPEESTQGGPRAPLGGDAHLQRRSTVTLEDGTTVDLVESGDFDGVPVYFLQTSSSPLLDAALVRALKTAGVRLIAPMRSGLGATSHLPTSAGPADWAALHAQVLDLLDTAPALIGGHRCGGIYALALAARLGAASPRVLLVDTGAPMTGMAMFHEMPTAPKRLFLAARFFPPALRTPYKLVSADFFNSPGGEERAVSYFYDGSPQDQAIVSQRRFWQATRDNIDYCLRNPMQTVQDVVHWTRDYGPLLNRVLAQTPVHFLHGGSNTVRRATHVETLAATRPGASCEIVPDRGQLLIYAEPDRFARTLRQQAG